MTANDTDAGQGPQAAEPLALRSNVGLERMAPKRDTT